MQHCILLVDNNPVFLKSMSEFLTEEGFIVRTAESGDDGIALIRQNILPFSLALVDYHMPGMDGPETIRRIKAHSPNLQIFGLSCDDTEKAHNESLDSGAIYFIEKDIGEAKLLGILHRTFREIERRIKPVVVSSHTENQKLIEMIEMVGVSGAMAEVARVVQIFGPSDEAVLIRGENGTGKEKVARAIHQNSPRRNKPFVAVNCAAIPANLIESELFGHTAGSFTGASKSRKGYFEAAASGTIFLDEIGDMAISAQAALLRVLEEKTIVSVGSTESRKIDFRLIAATNAPLEILIKEKKFRPDLFFRLSVLPVNIKALRERPEDIPALATAFLREENAEDKQDKILNADMLEELKKLPWPGNVRELEHCIKYLVKMSKGKVLDVDLLSTLSAPTKLSGASLDLESAKFNQMSDEKKIIIRAVEEGGSVSGGARILGISRSTLRDKMKKYKIELKRTIDEEVVV